MSYQKIYLLIKILSAVGTCLALYLLWQQLFHPAFRPCYINSVINCDAVISGPVAKTLGIPTPLFGLVGYMVIFWAAVIKNKKLLLGMTSFGLAFCLWIAYRELFQLRVICPVCIACQVVMVSVVILATGITAVYQAYMKSLDYLNYFHTRLYATFLLDNRLSEIQKEIAMTGEVSRQLLESKEHSRIANREMDFEFSSNFKSVEPLPNLFQVDMFLAWIENDRKVQMSRSAYILK